MAKNHIKEVSTEPANYTFVSAHTLQNIFPEPSDKMPFSKKDFEAALRRVSRKASPSAPASRKKRT